MHIIRRGSKEADAVLDHLALLKDKNGKENQEIAIRNLLSETWLMLLGEIEKHFVPPQVPDSEKQNQVKSMLSYIHRNYSEKITLAEIAREASVSTREANRIFQKTIRQPPL